jgi:hypothetical protein
MSLLELDDVDVLAHFLVAEPSRFDVVRDDDDPTAIVSSRGDADITLPVDDVVPAREPREGVRPGEPDGVQVVCFEIRIETLLAHTSHVCRKAIRNVEASLCRPALVRSK